MTKPKPRAATAAGAVSLALEAEAARRADGLKPIEVVKEAISAYLAYGFAAEGQAPVAAALVESEDRKGLRRGTKAAVDRLLFNANYWRAAYEDRITSAGLDPDDTAACLQAISVWTAHPLKLNRLSQEEATGTFERFCPPFAANHRRGSGTASAGRGPLSDFANAAAEAAARAGSEATQRIEHIVEDMRAETDAYDRLRSLSAPEALFEVLPAWCLQGRIELVNGLWWDDRDVMEAIIGAMHARFVKLGFGASACRYFVDSCEETLDAYHYDVSSGPTRFAAMEVPELLGVVRQARLATPTFEADGYGSGLPSWLISKEQLIWNVLACAFYGPASARPLLVDSPHLVSGQGLSAEADVISDLARASFERYTADRAIDSIEQEYAAFQHLPPDLRDSSIAYICSIHGKLETLGYEVLPKSACYPERIVAELSPSEVECLAILEHRRWIKERTDAGWHLDAVKDVEGKRSPYLVPWEELPERARE